MGFLASSDESRKRHLLPFNTSNSSIPGYGLKQLRSLRLWIILVACVSTLLFWFRYLAVPYGTNGNLDDILNRTLGFQQNFVISLPARTDRRDTFLAAASFAGFDFEWENGVSSDDVAPKAIPHNWKAENVGPGVLGSWRAHMNILQRIVHEKIQTALIWEDDADFDIALKQQLQQYARGMRALLESSGQTNDPHHKSPYGNGWDFLWIGHSKLGPVNNQTDFYVIENDPTVPPTKHRFGKWINFHLPKEVTTDDTRLIFKADNGGVSLQAYGVTYESARKALVTLSVIPRDGAVDVAYRNFCRGKLGVPFDCYGPYPTLVGSHRAAGPASRLSDNNADGSVNQWVDEYTADVRFSTTMNLPRLAAGEGDIEAQWSSENGRKIRRRIAEPLPGVGQLRQIDLAAAPVHTMAHGWV